MDSDSSPRRHRSHLGTWSSVSLMWPCLPLQNQGGKTNEQEENRMAVRQAAKKAVIRDEQNRRIQFAATNPIKEVLKNLHTTLRGLDAEAVFVSRTKYGQQSNTRKEISGQAAGRCIHQSLYRHPVLSGAGVHHDGYGVSLFFSFRQCAGGF